MEKETVDKTYVPKGVIEKKWVLIDASDITVGRLATQISAILLGKNKPTYTPGVETGDNVVVINARHIKATEKRLESEMYYHHSSYPGGLKSINLRHLLDKNPERVIKSAVWGMLPHNKWGRKILGNLKVYGEAEHPHQMQKPQPVK
jgi:large subunit ribosomal protein L13